MNWHSGDRIVVRGARWRVTRCTPFAGCAALDLAPDGPGAPRTLLLPYDRPRRSSPPPLRVVSRRRWAHATAARLQTSFPPGGLRFCPPGIRLLPYQLEPALAMLRHGVLRLLVADDVGLGKTVEAGLIVNEIARGRPLSRILVVCPASLVPQWEKEFELLFRMCPVRADAAWLRTVSRELPPDLNPWSLPGVYLSSIDFLKRAEVLSPLEAVRWDLLVLDEAHGATSGSHRRIAVDAAARRARRVVLLTATPHSGDDEQFASLCALGASPGSPPITIFRRTTADTPLAGRAARRTLLPVRPTQAEQRMHALLEAYTARVWIEARRRGTAAGELVATVLRKRALSSAGSLALSLRRRLRLLDGLPPEPSQLILPLDEEEGTDGAPGDSVLSEPGLEEACTEREALQEIAAAAEAAAWEESKLGALLRLLRRVREPSIVFSEYRDTAARLAGEISRTGLVTCLLHGGQSPGERAGALGRFARGDAVLVATDAASEGLNLQHVCRMVVHHELPWTPLRLHQRAGRVNRIGQTRRVHEIALVAAHTAEQLVLAPLVRRAGRAAAFAGDGLAQQLPESRVAGHILGGARLDLLRTRAPEPPVSSLDLRAEAADEAARLGLLRQVRRECGETRSGGRPDVIPVAGLQRLHRTPTRWLVIVGSRLYTRHGEAIAHAVTGVTLEPPVMRCPRRAGEILRMARAALPAIEAAAVRLVALDEERRGLAAAAEAVHRQVERALHERDREVYREMASVAPQLVQAGLFDRRALRAAGIRAAAAALDEDDRRPDRAGSRTARIVIAHEVQGLLLEG